MEHANNGATPSPVTSFKQADQEGGEPAEVSIHAALAAILGQVYCFTDVDGTEYHFDISAGYRFAIARGQAALFEFAFRECKIGMPELLRRYPDLNETYARSLPAAALKDPILFVPWKGQHLLIDGWHRLAKAVLNESLAALPAYLLTDDEMRRIIIAKKTPRGNQKPASAPPSLAAHEVQTLFARRFPPGQLTATVGAMAAICAAGDSPLRYLLLHISGEWGALDAEDRAANDRAVDAGGRILSSYRLRTGTTIWIITEADRSSTTILLPSEY